MKLKFNINAILQYILIYLCLFLNGSSLYANLKNNNYSIILLIDLLIITIGIVSSFINKSKYKNKYCLILLSILLFFICLVRYLIGGAGIQVFFEYASCILVVFLAISINKEKFIERLVNLVVFFAIISLFLFLIQIISPELFKSMLPQYNSGFSYNDWSQGYEIKIFYKEWGRIIYSAREEEFLRNSGIFTEPGNYQIILNCTLFMLLFFQKKVTLDNKKYYGSIFIIILTVLTCQSTSGYLCLIVQLLAFFIMKKNRVLSRLKRLLIGFGIFICIILIIDMSFRGNQSLLSTAIFNKLFDSSGSFGVDNSTGIWRIATINTSIDLMLSNPLGIGFDNAYTYIQSILSGSAGGALMFFGASLGIIPFISVLIWVLTPILITRKITIGAKLAYIFLYFNVEFAQSKVFYPFLIMIPLYLILSNNKQFNINLDKENR
ncbi:TPA: hypothetical protein ACY4SF_000986 [Clostridium perfringens]|uniref:hypothetical protein n=1 Tax=Clostridium perfringens TaxID=1502 RepID=UPI0018985577|nr:hypothetical protein [Clostridium perfringens]MDH5098872.1 O-Antigen ligase [Clostridium perfringens]HBI6978177.1 hypothetical protein [Clostridium perfringens]HBI7001366.1 hypothetical protein [Clostridium perfringens]